jgi:hypothetical protein
LVLFFSPKNERLEARSIPQLLQGSETKAFRKQLLSGALKLQIKAEPLSREKIWHKSS